MSDIRVTLIDARGVEAHLELPREVVKALLAVPTVQQFIEVPAGAGHGSMWREFMSTSSISRLLVHDSLD